MKKITRQEPQKTTGRVHTKKEWDAYLERWEALFRDALHLDEQHPLVKSTRSLLNAGTATLEAAQ